MSAFDKDDNSKDSASIQIMQRSIVSELSDEIRKTLRYYMKSKTGISYNNFYISGGSSNMIGLKESLNRILNIEFSALDPFQKIKLSREIKNTSSYAVLIGSVLSINNTSNKKTTTKNKVNFENPLMLKIFTKVKDWLFNERK